MFIVEREAGEVPWAEEWGGVEGVYGEGEEEETLNGAEMAHRSTLYDVNYCLRLP